MNYTSYVLFLYLQYCILDFKILFLFCALFDVKSIFFCDNHRLDLVDDILCKCHDSCYIYCTMFFLLSSTSKFMKTRSVQLYWYHRNWIMNSVLTCKNLWVLEIILHEKWPNSEKRVSYGKCEMQNFHVKS